MSNPLHYALVVEVHRYPGVSDLNSPPGDAQGFYDWLVGDGGVPPENIERVQITPPLPDPLIRSNATPTRVEFNNALGKLNESVQAAIKGQPVNWQQTRLYIYVSGHGIAEDAGGAALLMANSGLNWWGENIPCTAYLNHYEKHQYFREVVLFADCCRQHQPAVFHGPPFTGPQGVGHVETCLGYAALLGEKAYEPTVGANPDEARSYFTKALLEGLRGAAADRATGRIDSVTLSKYTTERVKILTKDKTYPQESKILADPARPIVFAIKPAAPLKRNVSIQFPPGFNQQAILFDSTFKEVARSDPAQGKWSLQLEDSYYEVRPHNEPDGRRFAGNGLFRVLGDDQHVQL